MKIHLVVSPYPIEGRIHVICSPKDTKSVVEILEHNGAEFLVDGNMEMEFEVDD